MSREGQEKINDVSDCSGDIPASNDEIQTDPMYISSASCNRKEWDFRGKGRSNNLNDSSKDATKGKFIRLEKKDVVLDALAGGVATLVKENCRKWMDEIETLLSVMVERRIEKEFEELAKELRELVVETVRDAVQSKIPLTTPTQSTSNSSPGFTAIPTVVAPSSSQSVPATFALSNPLAPMAVHMYCSRCQSNSHNIRACRKKTCPMCRKNPVDGKHIARCRKLRKERKATGQSQPPHVVTPSAVVHPPVQQAPAVQQLQCKFKKKLYSRPNNSRTYTSDSSFPSTARYFRLTEANELIPCDGTGTMRVGGVEGEENQGEKEPSPTFIEVSNFL